MAVRQKKIILELAAQKIKKFKEQLVTTHSTCKKTNTKKTTRKTKSKGTIKTTSKGKTTKFIERHQSEERQST